MLAFPAVLATGAWACKRLLGKISPSDKKIEILAIAMERGDAGSCGRHLMTMRAELRIKAIMLKKRRKKRDVDITVSDVSEVEEMEGEAGEPGTLGETL